MTIVCGDSHTATHGAFGSLAFGIGTSEVEHVLATQTLKQARAKTLKIEVRGKVAPVSPPKILYWRLSAIPAARAAPVTSRNSAGMPLRHSPWKAG